MHRRAQKAYIFCRTTSGDQILEIGTLNISAPPKSLGSQRSSGSSQTLTDTRKYSRWHSLLRWDTLREKNKQTDSVELEIKSKCPLWSMEPRKLPFRTQEDEIHTIWYRMRRRMLRSHKIYCNTSPYGLSVCKSCSMDKRQKQMTYIWHPGFDWEYIFLQV